MRAALFRLNVIEYCFRFSNERRGAYFCPTSIEGGALSSIRFVFITFVVNLYSIPLLHLWSIITFVALTSFLHVTFPIAVLLRASASGHQSAFWSMAHLGSCQLPNLFFYYGTHRPYSLFFSFLFYIPCCVT